MRELDESWAKRVISLTTRFIRQELTSSGSSKVVVGLSGGVDSAVAAALAARALGKEMVVGVYMPDRMSSGGEDAKIVAKALGLPLREIEITQAVEAVSKATGNQDKKRRGNLAARMRMITLYDISAAEGGIVLGTSNKSELLLGYGTIYGDLASGLNPLGDLYKTEVWALAGYLGIPEQVIAKPSSGDLWVGQTDEGELGATYAVIDRLLYDRFELRLKEKELIERGHDAKLVKDVLEWVKKSQFKRRPALICKVSPRTIGRDFRYPRDWER